MAYTLIVVSMTLNLMQGHSGSVEEEIQVWLISTAKQSLKIKLAATVGHENFYLLSSEIVSTRRLELWSHERFM